MEDSNLRMPQTPGVKADTCKQNSASCLQENVSEATSNSNSTTVASDFPSQNDENVERYKRIQLQLIFLYHAFKCRSGEVQQDEDTKKTCGLPNCTVIKQVLRHMTTCHAGGSCSVPYCVSSSQIISHWRNCTKEDCPVCVPLKRAAARRLQETSIIKRSQPYQRPSPTANIQKSKEHLFNISNGGVNMNSFLQKSSALPGSYMTDQLAHCSTQNVNRFQNMQLKPQPVSRNRSVLKNKTDHYFSSSNTKSFLNNILSKLDIDKSSVFNSQNRKTQLSGTLSDYSAFEIDWRQSLDPEQRRHIVRKIALTILPNANTDALRHPRMLNLLSYAENIESKIYITENSKESYYQKLSQTMHDIRNELEANYRRHTNQLSQWQVRSASVPGLSNSNSQTVWPYDNSQTKIDASNSNFQKSVSEITLDSMKLTEDWRQSVDSELRLNLVLKIVQTICPPVSNISSFTDPRMIAYARSVECDLLGAAKSKEEYYRLFAEKIFKMKKETEEKHEQERKSAVTGVVAMEHIQKNNS